MAAHGALAKPWAGLRLTDTTDPAGAGPTAVPPGVTSFP